MATTYYKVVVLTNDILRKLREENTLEDYIRLSDEFLVIRNELLRVTRDL